MIVQSSGGKLYAVLARTPEDKGNVHHIGLMPALAVISTTLFVQLRVRYVAEQAEWIDPMGVPKQVLLAGVERSKNTLRGVVFLNTGAQITDLKDDLPKVFAEQIINAADGFLYDDECFVTKADLREDFITDFAKLCQQSYENFYPPLKFGNEGQLLSPVMLEQMKKTAVALDNKTKLSLVAPPETPTEAEPDKIVKVKFGDQNPEPPAPETDPEPGALTTGVDEEDPAPA